MFSCGIKIDPDHWIGLEKAAWPVPLLDPNSQSFRPIPTGGQEALSLPLCPQIYVSVRGDAMGSAGKLEFFHHKAAHFIGRKRVVVTESRKESRRLQQPFPGVRCPLCTLAMISRKGQIWEKKGESESWRTSISRRARATVPDCNVCRKNLLTKPTSITLSVGTLKFAIFVLVLSLTHKNTCNSTFRKMPAEGLIFICSFPMM
jgi:hypothetical protein